MELTDVAAAIDGWLTEGRRVGLAWPVGFAGFSSRRPEEALAVDEAGQTVGGVLGPAITQALAGQLAERLGQPPGPVQLIRMPVDEQAAAAAGLACGGTVTVAMHEAGRVPARFWRAVADGEPVALVSRVRSDGTPGQSDGTPALLLAGADVLTGGLGDPAIDAEARAGAGGLLAGGRTAARVVPVGDEVLVVIAVVPPARLLVVGAGDLADALDRQARLLGWRPEVVGRPGPGIAGLGPADGMVVLSHDRDVDVPALRAALDARVGYIGALGSRRTQAARRECLLAAGVAEEALAAVRGPAGLDLGGRAPEEIALAICAEMLAVRAGRTGAALVQGTGSINRASSA